MNDELKLLVFDWDGTLMDSEGRILACLSAAIDDLGLEHRDDDALRNIIGLGLREAVDTLFPGADEILHRELTARYRHHYLEANETPTPLFAGVRELLEDLSARGHLLAVATGKGRSGLNQALAQSGLGELFAYTRCADEALSKPNPQMLLDVMDVLGAEPGETLMIGDTEYDMLMANNAGTHALAVTYGVHTRERLLSCGPRGCVDSVAAMGEWLRGGAQDRREAS
ncbi:MAG: HAD-IA family hydrolase [Gammaproteobacteria bacterium]